MLLGSLAEHGLEWHRRPAMPATICLNMIVKNEARVLGRCLDSVRPFIDTWVIVDTGSSDGTQALVRSLLGDLPGELFERPWRNFGHNRSEALELARGRADYTLIIDADEVWVPDPGFRLPELTADEYLTLHAAGESPTRFFLPQLVRSALPWRYEGVLHEAIRCDEPHSTAKLPGILCKGFFDGARNADPKAKYAADARVLEEALSAEPDNARYAFYLAQSHRDAGNPERAIEAYARRATMGGFAEEVFYSVLQLGLLLEKQGGPYEPAQAALLRAYQLRPTRAEPLCELARHHREAKDYALAHLFAGRAKDLPRPDDVLFVDDSVYDWRALDEYAIAAYWVGEPRASLAACDQLLAGEKLPQAQRARVEKNRAFALEALAKQPPDKSVKNRQKRARRARR